MKSEVRKPIYFKIIFSSVTLLFPFIINWVEILQNTFPGRHSWLRSGVSNVLHWS